MMATEWDADTVLRVRALRVKAGEKYGDPCDMAVGEYPDGKWWCRLKKVEANESCGDWAPYKPKEKTK